MGIGTNRYALGGRHASREEVAMPPPGDQPASHCCYLFEFRARETGLSFL